MAAGTRAAAIDQAASQAPPPKPVSIPIKVDVILTRLQGDRKVASLPFSLWLTVTNYPGNQSLRTGIDVPVGTTTITSGRSNPTGPQGAGSTSTSEATTKTEYRYVGTDIDCMAQSKGDGQFSITVTVADSSVYTSDPDPKAALKVSDPMAFRTFRMSNTMAMVDGQTRQLAMATDKVTGETIRVDVMLTLVK
jgi:hypothetical protein